jgi:hypothetical protein
MPQQMCVLCLFSSLVPKQQVLGAVQHLDVPHRFVCGAYASDVCFVSIFILAEADVFVSSPFINAEADVFVLSDCCSALVPKQQVLASDCFSLLVPKQQVLESNRFSQVPKQLVLGADHFSQVPKQLVLGADHFSQVPKQLVLGAMQRLCVLHRGVGVWGLHHLADRGG